MRVLIELFDKEPVENMIATCAFEPDIVVFLCDSADAGFFKESAVYRVIRRRKLKTKARFYYMDSTDTKDIRKFISAVVHDYPGCVFNFSGGRDLMLIVAGAYCFKHKIPAFYVDVKNKRLINVLGCEQLVPKYQIPHLPFEDYFAMSGATIQGHGHFSPENMTEDFEKDVVNVWEIISYNPRAWGEFSAYLQKYCSGTPANQLVISAVKNQYHNNAILRHLQNCGVMLNSFKKNSRSGTITFKSALHKKCLLNQGIWLELFCYVQAKRTGFFDDVQTSVIVDWDGVEGGSENTKNEVDVLLMKDAIPVFISCKMGLPSPLALSEIRLLASKFGGTHSRAVLLTGGLLSSENKALQTRANDLRIYLVDRSFVNENDLGKELMRIAEDTQKCRA